MRETQRSWCHLPVSLSIHFSFLISLNIEICTKLDFFAIIHIPSIDRDQSATNRSKNGKNIRMSNCLQNRFVYITEQFLVESERKTNGAKPRLPFLHATQRLVNWNITPFSHKSKFCFAWTAQSKAKQNLHHVHASCSFLTHKPKKRILSIQKTQKMLSCQQKKRSKHQKSRKKATKDMYIHISHVKKRRRNYLNRLGIELHGVQKREKKTQQSTFYSIFRSGQKNGIKKNQKKRKKMKFFRIFFSNFFQNFFS